MTVKFKLDYVMYLHDINIYKNSIEKDGVEEEIAFNNSLVKLNRGDIKDITKSTDGSAIIKMKNKFAGLLTTFEDYEDVIEVMRKADLALDIMYQEKVYIFDDFKVDDDELNMCDVWKEMKNR